MTTQPGSDAYDEEEERVATDEGMPEPLSHDPEQESGAVDDNVDESLED